MDQNFPFYELESGCTAQHSGALAALRLLRSYNHFLVPPDIHGVVGPLLGNVPQPCLPPPTSFCYQLPVRNSPFTSPISPTQHTPPSESEIRRRGEKRPIPPELKDDKYFERRRRNNQAAKKSRDARRIREDQIAWRACMLEQENAALRAHVAALRREAITLRAMLARDDPAPSSTTPD